MEEKTQNPNVEPAKEMTEAELSELLQIRRDKLKALQDAGQDPFRKVRYDQQFYSTDITSNYESFEDKTVSVAGRMMSKRIMGKASFAHILDYKGDIQIYVKRDDIGEESYAQFKTFDIGDIIGVVGRVFKTRTGEISIHAEKVELLSKSLRPLPEKFHGLKDPELRYRQRFVDLIVNPEVRDTFVKRSIIISEMRSWLNNKGFIEVETPVLNTTASGASARPFITHHNTLDIDMYMRIATELHLKMCIVGGLERVYEIGRIFRNEGMDATHNPEFTTIELYQAYTDYKGMMELAESVIDHCCKAVNGGRTKITYQGSEIDLTAPFKRVTMNDAVREKTGVDFMSLTDEQARAEAKRLGVEVEDKTATAGKILPMVFDAFVEDTLIQPTFVIDYPVEISPLSKRKPDDPRLTERRPRVRQRLLRAERPHRPAGPLHTAGHGARQGRRRGHDDRRDLLHRPRIRNAPHRRHRPGNRPPCDAAYRQPHHTRRAAVPHDEAEPLTGQKSISYKTPHSIDRGFLRRQMCGLLKKLMLF